MKFGWMAQYVGCGLFLITGGHDVLAQSVIEPEKQTTLVGRATDRIAVEPHRTNTTTGAVMPASKRSKPATSKRMERARPASDPSVAVLDPIVVQARRRSELAKDVPLSTTVFQSKDIGTDRIDSLERAINAAPNMVFNPQGGPIIIRGISSLGPTGGVDRPQSAGVFLDDVYIARPHGIPNLLDDYGRVELVRGPQATLYGMNTLGGAINLISPEPVSARHGMLEGGIGSNGMRTLKGSFDAPLVPGSLYTHGFLAYGHSDGYVTNAYNGSKVLGGDNLIGKFGVLGHAGDATTLRINVDYSHIRDDGTVAYSPVQDALRRRANYNFPQHRKNDIGGVSARIDHTLEDFQVTSITALRGYSFDFKLDGDFTQFPYYWQQERQNQSQFSQEFRLTSHSQGLIGWMMGASYMFENYRAEQLFGLETMRAYPDRNTFAQTSDTLSIFGQLGWEATDRLNLTAGLRYTRVVKDAVAETFSPLGFSSFGPPSRVSSTPEFDNVSPEFSANYRFTDTAMGFARISRGFLAGGMTQFISAAGVPNLYKPETAWTYEAGAKTRWLDDRLELNLTGFYNDIINLQVVQFTSPTTRIVTNAGASTSYGLELEARARLTHELSLTSGYGYTHAKFDNFIDPILRVDYSGQDIPFAPRHSISVGVDWRHAVGNDVILFAGANYSYKSSYLFTPSSTYRQDAVNLVDARIGLERGPYSLSLYARNLLDERYLNGFFDSRGTVYGSAALGRTFGLLAKATW